MARTKYPEITRKKILSVALDLFLEKGYLNTTIQDIINNTCGLSKGAIYYYFSSKEELFDTLCEETFSCKDIHDQIENDQTLTTGIEKTKHLIHLILFNKINRLIYMSAHVPLDNSFLAKIFNNIFNIASPLFEEYITLGNQDESIPVKHPKQIAELVMLIINFWLSPLTMPTDKKSAYARIEIIENIFKQINCPIFDSEVDEDFKLYIANVFNSQEYN